MISEAGYLEQLRSCAKFNKRLINQRRRPGPFFDHQTGIAQRPSTHLVRHVTERCPTQTPLEVYRYTAKKWKANSKVPFDSVEFKYILGIDPALKGAIDNLMNPDQANVSSWQNDTSNDSPIPPPAKFMDSFEEHVEYEEFEHDDLDHDLSDEDDWGDKKRKRRRGVQKDVSFKGPSRRGGGTANNTPTNVDNRPFVCPECGARYKSRPGLTYHKLHNHAGESGDSTPKSPKRFPQVQKADECDFCQGTRIENKKTGKAEDLVSCKDCGRSAHPSCLKFTPNMIVATKRHGWQCIECKSCGICGTSEHDEKLLFCDSCDRGYHCYCLTPPLKEPPENDWSCETCQAEFGDKATKPPA